MEIWLDIQSQEGNRRVPFIEDRLIIGRGEAADVQIASAGLSRRHASIHRDQGGRGRIWILDEESANGVSVNEVSVPPQGTPLSDGDVIRLSDDVTIRVRFGNRNGNEKRPAQAPAITTPRLTLVAVFLLGAVFLSGIAALAIRQFSGSTGNSGQSRKSTQTTPTIEATGTTETGSLQAGSQPIDTSIALPPSSAPSASSASSALGSENQTAGQAGISGAPARKLYLEMNRGEQEEFLGREAQRVTQLIGSREDVFEREVIGYIKEYVDGYARRVGNGNTRLWGEDLSYVFKRARKDAPYIISSFRLEGVPVILGLYLPMIETEYNECLRSPVGALGLFQFMPDTARGYGVSPDDRCRVEKMAPAAARYMKDRILEFGTGGTSVALGIAAYNRSPQSVRRDLQDVLLLSNQKNERSFWTLLAQKERLDQYFRNENVKYVPKFFAATIVGENPETFGLAMRKLSTYDQNAPASREPHEEKGRRGRTGQRTGVR